MEIGVQSGIRTRIVLNRNIRLLNCRRERVDLVHVRTDLLVHAVGNLRKAAGS